MLPDPNGVGAQRRAAQHLAGLCTFGEVTVLLPWHSRDKNVMRVKLAALGVAKVIEHNQLSASGSAMLAHQAASNQLVRAYRAMRCVCYLDGSAQPADRPRWRAQLGNQFDMVFAFRMLSATWIDSIFEGHGGRAAINIVDLDDIESITFETTTLKVGDHSLFWQWKLRRDWRWLKAKERDLVSRWTATSVCSALDAARFRLMTGHTAWVIPNSFRCSNPGAETVGPVFSILFVGAFSYFPNTQGIHWFMADVWPQVVAAIGGRAKLVLAGFHPPEDISTLTTQPGVEVIANALDLSPVYEAANIVIVPLLTGSGTRIKVLEAAAYHRAIVTTVIGCEGLDLVNDVHAAIVDNAADFADALIRLANNPSERARLVDAAWMHVEKSFSPKTVQHTMVGKINELLSGRA